MFAQGGEKRGVVVGSVGERRGRRFRDRSSGGSTRRRTLFRAVRPAAAFCFIKNTYMFQVTK